ncbi:cationic amino acid transporter 8 [Artemisia annua]|uniref:Cationic amino acid transporter 8 n=1 Tax=Artemisia annua TaxID=35608 RepID=A0A2U1NQ22_ARTAN|nr:cationic amino acid transporter 8 [Artemisia annua]
MRISSQRITESKSDSENQQISLYTPLNPTNDHQQEETNSSYWRFTKNDFFPEPSFQTFTSYTSALSHTLYRFRDRFFGRSSDVNELIELKKQTRDDAGPAIVLSYAVSGLSALFSVFCYTEFAVEIPVAGGSFSYLRVELGDFVAFIAAGNLILEAVVGTAGLARSFSSYLASMFSSNPDLFRIQVDSFAEGFNLLDPVAVLILYIASMVAMRGTKLTSFSNMILSIISSLVIIFIIVVGFIHGNTSNLEPFFPYGAEGVFKAAAVVYWSYAGFDLVANMAEETRNPARDIPLGLVGSMSLISAVYCLMALALPMMVKYTEIDRDAAFSVAFEKIGMKWAKYVVSLCALKGMFTCMMITSMGQARYTTQIARSHMIPPWFALVHPKTGTPIYATLLVTITSCTVALFSSLDVLSSLLSLSTLFIFILMAIALLVRRYYVKDTTSKYDMTKFMACLFVIIGSCIGLTALWGAKRKGWIGYVAAGGLFFAGTIGMALLPKQRVPKKWGVPLVPWFPALSILMNMFLIGSLGSMAFVRFFICSGAMLVYYLLIGVHATYDFAHQGSAKT